MTCWSCGETGEPGQDPYGAFCCNCGVRLGGRDADAEPATPAQPWPAVAPAPDADPTPDADATPDADPDATPDADARATPDLAVLARDTWSQIGTSGLLLAAGSAAIGLVVLVALGFAMARLPTDSVLGNGTHVPELRFALGRAAELTMANLHGPGPGVTLREVPVLLLVLPLLAVGIPARLLAGRTRDLPVRLRLLWGATAGPMLGVLLLICAAAAGDLNDGGDGLAIAVSGGGAFVLGTLWGSLAGVAGTARAISRERDGAGVTWPWPGARRTLWAALRPLVITLALAAVAGTVFWSRQSLTDAGRARTLLSTPRPGALAAFDAATFLVDNGLHLFELGSGVGFHEPGMFAVNGMPVPVERFRTVTGPYERPEVRTPGDVRAVFEPPGRFRVFAYADAVPLWGFLLLLAVSVACALTAIRAGYRTAFVSGARDPLRAAAWGALVGPVWAVALLVLNALVQKQLGGKADGNDVLVVYLFIGSALGALGGALAAGAEAPPAIAEEERTATEAPPPATPSAVPRPRRRGRLWSDWSETRALIPP